MRYLVTGGAGFIGSNVVAMLEGAGHDVVVCDRLRRASKWKNIAKRCLAGIVLPEGLDAHLASAATAYAAVIHMGAISATTVTDGDLVAEVNFNLSKKLWAWCVERKTPLIYASSAATYGDGSAGFSDTWSPSALAAFQPLNLYGWSKHLFDRWVSRQLETGEPVPPQWVGLKFFNVYGPNEYHKGDMQSVISKLFDKLSNGQPVTLFKSHRAGYADGAQSRDFVYVKDCAEIVRWFLAHEEISGIYNVGTGLARSFRDLASGTMRAMNVEIEIQYTDMPLEIRDRYQYFTEADMQSLRAAGYDRPFHTLEAGIADYVGTHLQTSDPYL